MKLVGKYWRTEDLSLWQYKTIEVLLLSISDSGRSFFLNGIYIYIDTNISTMIFHWQSVQLPPSSNSNTTVQNHYDCLLKHRSNHCSQTRCTSEKRFLETKFQLCFWWVCVHSSTKFQVIIHRPRWFKSNL